MKILRVLFLILILSAMILPALPVQSANNPAIGEEILSQRTKYSKTFYRGNGSYEVQITGSPLYTLDQTTGQYVDYKFQNMGTYYKVQHPWVSVEFYPTYTKIWNETFTQVLVYNDSWDCEYLNKQGNWVSASAYSPVLSYQIVSDGIILTRTYQTTIGPRAENYYFKNGSALKITLDQTTTAAQTIRFNWNMSGIVCENTANLISAPSPKKVNGKIITEPSKILGSVFKDSNGKTIGQISLQDALDTGMSEFTPVYSTVANGKKVSITCGTYNSPAGGTVELDPSSNFTSISADGDIYNHLHYTQWSTLQSYSWGNVEASNDYFWFGCYFWETDYNYYLSRGFLLFDTSSLSAYSITSASLNMYYYSVSDEGSSIVVQSGQPTYPHNPLVTNDFNQSYYSGNYGSKTLSSVTGGYNSITLNNMAIINKTGTTKLCLRTSADIAGSQPSEADSVAFYSYEKGQGYQPYLSITYESLYVAPTVTTQAASSITYNSATGNGNITNTGGINATERGFQWDTDSGAPYANNVHENGSYGTGAYSLSLTGLPSGTTIYYRAYATNEAATGYGSEQSFLTKPAAPTNVSATDGSDTAKVVITWTKSTGATGYKVYRNNSNISGSLGDVATYDDSSADAGVITPGTATASDGISISYVTLSLAGESVANGTSYTYKVVAFNATGDSPDSSTDTGYRGYGSLTYQWQRSAADSDSSYSDIGGATTNPYNDTSAPAYPAARYFKCVVSATGATNATSTSDRGWELGLPVILIKDATNVSFTSATLNSEVTDDGGATCQVRFGYGTVSHIAADFEDYTVKTAWIDNYHTGDKPPANVISLSVAQVYFCRVQIKNTGGTVTSTNEVRFDTTDQPSILQDYTISSSGSEFLTGDPMEPPQLYTELDVSKIPGGDVINQILEDAGLTGPATAIWWFPLIFISIGIVGLLLYGLTAKNGEGSDLLMFIVVEAGLVLFGILGVANTSSLVPLWPMLLYPLGDIPWIMSKKQNGWG